MNGERNNPLDLEKQNISKRLKSLEDVVADAIGINKKMFMKIYGDPDSNPPIDSFEIRIKKLEETEKHRENGKQALIKTALGSVTISVGAIILWVITVLRDAFIHK